MSIRTERQGTVLTVIIDRPEVRNAVNGPTAVALAETFRRFDADDSLAVAVLCGNGNFCAGADLQAVASGENINHLDAEGEGPMGPTRMLLNKPVIAAIEGHAVAGGLELALWCDLRVAADDAVMGVFCRRFGVPLIDGGTVRLPRLIGLSRALDLILTGRPINATEGLQMGLINRICPAGQARAVAEALALQISRFPALCMRNDRMSTYEQWDLNLDAALANEFQHGMAVIRSGETLDGASRFRDGEGRHGQFDDAI
ncbi:MAG TPA: crotonase/enoyl-CoA hydratase family protein [Dongiaceae bacterium]|nr:crotonase/enoyl-CoA hydratase family protein [Dongiaceae bacterium]